MNKKVLIMLFLIYWLFSIYYNSKNKSVQRCDVVMAFPHVSKEQIDDVLEAWDKLTKERFRDEKC